MRRHLGSFLLLLLQLIWLEQAHGEDAFEDAPPAQCVYPHEEGVPPCSPDATTRATAYPLNSSNHTFSAYFYAPRQELWFSTVVMQDSLVDLSVMSFDGGPYLEAFVYRNDIYAHMAHVRYNERDPRANDSIHRWSLGSVTAGTVLSLRLQTTDWEYEEMEFILARPSFVIQPLDTVPQPSDKCGENCPTLCQHWGGPDGEREAVGFATHQCVETSPSTTAACQCYCNEGIVGDVHGSGSCDEDDGLKAGGKAGIVIAVFVLVLMVAAPLCFYLQRKRQHRTKAASVLQTKEKDKGNNANIHDGHKPSVYSKDPTETDFDTERHDEEEGWQGHQQQQRHTAIQTQALPREQPPAAMWDHLLSLPDATPLYTRVQELSGGTILVTRKFRLHTPAANGKTSKRLKVLFPDAATAAHHGFVVVEEDNKNHRDNDKKHNHKENLLKHEHSETTESETEAEQTVIHEVPSILPPPRQLGDSEPGSKLEQPPPVGASIAKRRGKSKQKKSSPNPKEIVDAIERRMAETASKKRPATQRTKPTPSMEDPAQIAARVVQSGTRPNTTYTCEK